MQRKLHENYWVNKSRYKNYSLAWKVHIEDYKYANDLFSVFYLSVFFIK